MRRLAVTFDAVCRRARTALLVIAGVVTLACTANEVDIPDLYGPSARAESLQLFANPDALVADGSSFAIVQAVLRDKNAQPIRGRAVLFKITDEDGREASIGTLSSDAGKGTVITDANGVAQAIYTSPPRTDATANQSILIQARVLGTDFNGERANSVRIELRSAEPRLFPQNPGNALPLCNFLWEAPNGYRAPAGVLFQTTASDPDGTIVRYEWTFGDDPRGGVQYSPDTGHIFRTPGRWTVLHVVTDDDGGQSSCAAAFTIT
jgi:hypothetical protein